MRALIGWLAWRVYCWATGPLAADTVEMDHFGSPGRKKEFVQGLLDEDEATVAIGWGTIVELPGSDHENKS